MGSHKQSPGEKDITKCSTLAFERLFVGAAAIVYQESHFWTRLRTDDQELFALRK